MYDLGMYGLLHSEASSQVLLALLFAMWLVDVAVAIVGCSYAFRAFLQTASQPTAQRLLKLVIMNLTEPLVTTTTFFLAFVILLNIPVFPLLLVFILPAVPLTWMLLAPIWNPLPQAQQVFQKTLIIHGVLRLLSTIALWICIASSRVVPSSNLKDWGPYLSIFSVLNFTGLIVLCSSVFGIARILRALGPVRDLPARV